MSKETAPAALLLSAHESAYSLSSRGRKFSFALSPSPEYRSAIRDTETGEVTALRWDGGVDHWVDLDPTEKATGEK